MDKVVMTGAIVALVAVLALPLMAHVVKEGKAAEVAAAPRPKPKPVPKPLPKPTPKLYTGQPGAPQFQLPQDVKLPEGMAMPEPGKPWRPAPEVLNAKRPRLNARNLAGSVWDVDGVRVELRRGGQAVARHPDLPPELRAQGIVGTWCVHNKCWLRISTLGFIIEAQIIGKQVIGPNGPIRRIK